MPSNQNEVSIVAMLVALFFVAGLCMLVSSLLPLAFWKLLAVVEVLLLTVIRQREECLHNCRGEVIHMQGPVN